MPRLTDEQRLVMEGLIACARGTESYLNDYDALRAALLRCDEADKMDECACACITELANEVLSYRMAGHMRFNSTRKNPRGSITDEAREAIKARLIEQLDKHGYDLRPAEEPHDAN